MGNTETVTVSGGAFSVDHVYADDNAADEYSISVTLSDDDGGAVTETVTVGVTNVDPTLTLDAVTAIAEGDTATLSGTYSDVGVDDTHEIVIDWGDGNTETVTVSGGTFSVDHVYVDDNAADEYTVSVTLSDDDGGTVTEAATVEVTNVDPTLTLDAVTAIVEGDTATLSGTYADVGVDDTHEIVIDWGDGNTETVTVNGGAFSVDHVYADDNAADEYTVSVTLSDDDGGAVTEAATFEVTNVDPTLTLDAVTAIVEGDTATLSGTYADVGVDDTHEIVIDWGDGNTETVTVSGRTFSVDHVYADDNAADEYTISVTLSDDDGGAVTETTTVGVTNVDPTLTLDSVTAIVEGDTATLSGTYADVGAADTHEILIDWGDGNTETLTVSGGTFSVDHVYVDDNAAYEYTVSVTLSDDDGGAVTETVTVEVTNVDPTLTLDAVTAIVEGGTATLSGIYADVGAADTHEILIDWGDGNTETVTVSGGTFSVDHVYVDDNAADEYTVSVTLSDDDGGTVTEAATVEVTNVDPTSTLDAVTAIVEGDTATLSGTYADVGAADTHEILIDWGDGNTETVTVSGETFSVDHVYVDDMLQMSIRSV